MLSKHERLLERFEKKRLEFNKTKDKERKELIKKEVRELVKDFPALKGFYSNARVFWDSEALIWKYRIEPEYREFVRKFLKRKVKGKILDIGCGSYPYFDSVCLDISHNMLSLVNGKRVQADVEKGLPFKKDCFDTVLMVFLLKYVKNIEGLLKEAKRVCKGKIIIVESLAKTNDWFVEQLKQKDDGFDEFLIKLLKKKRFKFKKSVKKVGKKELLIVKIGK